MTALALVVASLHAAFALRGERRSGLAETLLVAFLVFSAAIALVMFGLGAVGAVSATSVAIATWLVVASTLAGTVAPARSRGGWSRVAQPWREASRALANRTRTERPLFHAALLLLAALFGYSVIQAWLLPSDSWDGIWYHDTITGWVIQTGGTRPIPLPMNLIQQANGFPKLAELTSAWWCLTVGREAAELSNLLAVPAFGAGVYLLARRFSARDLAMGIACVVLLLPGSLLQWRTTYVDILVSAFGVASLHFAAPPARSRGTDALFAVSMGLAVTTKWNVLPLLPGLLVVWLLASSPRRSLADWLTTAAVLLTPLAAVAFTAVPNLRHFDNPIWPVGVSLPRLEVHWPGVQASAHMNFNAGPAETAAGMLLPAAPGRDFADIRKGGYGLAFPWLLVPLALVSLASLVIRALRAGSSDRRAIAAKRAPLLRALAILGPVVPFIATSPAIWSARYLLVGVAAIAGASMGWGRAPPIGGHARRVATALIALAVAVSLHRVSTFDPALGGASLAETWRAMGRSRAERAATAPAPWTIAPEVAVLRERELTRGSLVLFGDEVAFPAVLYNDRFDNRVEYLGGAGPFDEAVERLQPTWIVASDDEPLGAWVRARGDRWEPIGPASRGLPTTAYRKRTPR